MVIDYVTFLTLILPRNYERKRERLGPWSQSAASQLRQRRDNLLGICVCVTVCPLRGAGMRGLSVAAGGKGDEMAASPSGMPDYVGSTTALCASHFFCDLHRLRDTRALCMWQMEGNKKMQRGGGWDLCITISLINRNIIILNVHVYIHNPLHEVANVNDFINGPT